MKQPTKADLEEEIEELTRGAVTNEYLEVVQHSFCNFVRLDHNRVA